MHEATTLIVALKYYQPSQVLVRETPSGAEYVFVPRANISMTYVQPEDVDNLLGRKAGCNCGGSKRQQAFYLASESDIRRWENGGREMTKLNIGPGISGTGDVKIDLFPFDGVDHVLDLAIQPIPYPDNYFDEVEASQVLEHIPTQLRWLDNGWHLRFCRVELMREIYRVLKPGGILLASVPGVDVERGVMRWAQDPTHCDVPWILESFDYFCNAWGGGTDGHEANLSSGINFGFTRIRHEYNEDRSVLTVWLKKP